MKAADGTTLTGESEIRNIIDDYDTMRQYLNFISYEFEIGPECIFPLSSDGFKPITDSRERD